MEEKDRSIRTQALLNELVERGVCIKIAGLRTISEEHYMNLHRMGVNCFPTLKHRILEDMFAQEKLIDKFDWETIRKNGDIGLSTCAYLIIPHFSDGDKYLRNLADLRE